MKGTRERGMFARYARVCGCVLGGLLWGIGAAGANVISMSPGTAAIGSNAASSDLGNLLVTGSIIFQDSGMAPGALGGGLGDIYTLTNALFGGYGGNTVTATISLPESAGTVIDNLTTYFYLGTTSGTLLNSVVVTNGTGMDVGSGTNGAGVMTVAVAPGLLYTLFVTGTVASASGGYVGSITPTSNLGSTPLPGALVLFGTVFAGAGMFIRRRRASGLELAA
jgi:hypothetical protein